MEYIFFYELSKSSREARTYNYTTKQFKTMMLYDVYKLPRYYFLPKGYEPCDQGLKTFSNDFFIAVNKISDNDIFKFDYLKYKSHESATVEMFKKLCHGKFENMDEIDCIEYEWIESCNNAGLSYCKPGKYNCYGYDYSSQYPSILASKQFEIPTKKGIQKTIQTIDYNNLEVGFYRVKICSDDERFKKVFGFSKQNVYTHISLMFAYTCKTKNGYEINMELILETNNCYIYGKNKKDHIANGSDIFKSWFNYLFSLKETHPESKVLIKLITSSLWGRLSEFNRLFKTDEEIENEKLDVSLEYDINHKYYIRTTKINKHGDDVCELINTKKPYYFNIARIKPFLLAKSRDLIGKVAIKYIDDVVRICTDNVAFNKQHDDVIFTKNTLKLTSEEKTTGLIKFKYVNCYKNYTTGFETKHFNKGENDFDEE